MVTPAEHEAPTTALPPRSFQRFFQTEALGGIVLVICGIAALIAANSPLAEVYEALWHAPLVVSIGGAALSLTFHQFINDGLMAVFFLLVGLEIKRELVAGELSSFRHATLPIAGAIGGMVVPAAIYSLWNIGSPDIRGWGIPMATDIAFALGTLSLIAPRAPTGAKVFLAALAIVDDMGAVLVIALFYTSTIAWGALAAAGVILAALIALNLSRVRMLTPYLVLGVALWFFLHESGVHATIAGVLLAFTIPTRTKINAMEFSQKARSLLDEFDRTETGDYLVITSKGQQEALYAIERASEEVTAPLLRLEHGLHNVSAFLVMPLFAFANAGVHFAGSAPDFSIAVGVIMGLVIGKPLGIMAASYAAVAMGRAALPSQVTWGTLNGCAWLGGIGFTMSLFIAGLAFGPTPQLDAAKVGILAASVLAAAGAVIFLRAAGTTRRNVAQALASGG